MQFMDLLEEWLRLREMGKDRELYTSEDRKQSNYERKQEIEDEINKRMRGEL